MWLLGFQHRTQNLGPTPRFFESLSAMTLARGAIRVQLHSQQTRERFEHLLVIAGSRSIFAWSSLADAIADVVVVDDAVLLEVQPTSATCTIYVGNNPAHIPRSSPWSLGLPPDYSIADLTDALDRAAVFLMDWRARAQSNWQQRLPDDRFYRLGAWVLMGPPFHSREHKRALTLLTYHSLTLDELCLRSDLNTKEARALLSELQRHRAIVITPPPPRGPRDLIARTGTVFPGLALRLKRWWRRSSTRTP
jgi:hypothetical protein